MKDMPVLGLPDYSWEEFANSQLVLVAAQVTFPQLPRLDDLAPKLQEALKREYPRFSEIEVPRHLVEGGQAVLRRQKRYRYASLNEQWAVVVGPTIAGIECRGTFTNIEDLLNRVTIVWRELKICLELDYQLRLALRFVNEFRHPEAPNYEDWRLLLNEELMGFDPKTWFNGTVTRAITELIIALSPQTTLAVRRGFLDSSTVSKSQETSRPSQFYLFDLDCFNSEPSEFNINPTSTLRQYSDILYRIFRKAIDRPDKRLYNYLKSGLS